MKFREIERLELRVKELEEQIQTRDNRYQPMAHNQVERGLNVVMFDEDHYTNLEFRN